MYRIEELDPRNISYTEFGEREAVETALSEPTYDYFSDQGYALRRPKAIIGSYVADQGFNVPLITSSDEWQAAIDAGEAMVRSESHTDYAGFRGLFSSMRIPVREKIEGIEGEPLITQKLAQLAIEGLREGEISPEDYMKYFAGSYRTWPESLANILQSAQSFNVKPRIDMPEASLWRYITGDNISIFGDPHVEGRYHVGFSPIRGDGWRIPGGLWIEPGEHAKPKRFRKHNKDFIPQPVIDIYEAIATLPLFDITERPVMELQMSADGVIHFLQYFMTGHRKAYTDPFDLPFSPKEDIKLEMVRGVTPPEGLDLKLFICPKRFERGMEGEAVYCSLLSPRGIDVQFVSKLSKFILHEAYISFQDNHFSSAPLLMPPVAAGFDWFSKDTNLDVAQNIHEKLRAVSFETYHDDTTVRFFNIHIASNGREIVLGSDWQVQHAAYEDFR
jgi:hypothetical protein